MRNWFVSEAGIDADGASRIVGFYVGFQEWYYERQMAAGFSEDDIRNYPTSELLAAMTLWMEEGRPV